MVLGVKSREGLIHFEISTLMILLELCHLPSFPLITSMWHKNRAGQMSQWLEKITLAEHSSLMHSSTHIRWFMPAALAPGDLVASSGVFGHLH